MDIIKSDIVSLHGAAISMIGGRPENQDDMAYLDTPLGFLIIVCDGMGGGPGGKTASSIVKQVIAETICECSPQTPRDHALKMAAARAHQTLEEKMQENFTLSGMGSTFVAALLNNQSAVIAHSGDSRCYRLHGKKCVFRTQDHSLVAELVRKKVMTEEDARQSPQANVITRGLGSTNNHVPEIDEIPYKKGDRFVLCTDGVWGSMQHQELLKEFTQAKDLQQLLSDLSTQVDKIGFSKGGGHDNHTIAMFELEKDSQLKDNYSWKKWAIISSAAVIITALICCCLWAILNSKEQKGHSTSQSVVSAPSGVPSSSDNPNYVYSAKTENTEDNSGTDTEVRDSTGKGNINSNANTDDDRLQNLQESKQFNEDARNKLLERMGRLGRDSDSIANQKSKKQNIKETPNPNETVQKIINRYDSAKVVGGKTIEEARKKLEAKKAEIKELFVILSDQTKNNKTHQAVERISNAVDALHSWDIAKEPDSKSKLYVPTAKAKGLMDKQIGRLKELKRNLEKE